MGRIYTAGLIGGTGVAAAWSPSNLGSDVQVWISAAYPTSITKVTGVSQWSDLGVNAHHLLQATGSKQPTYPGTVINGVACVTADGINDVLQATFASAQPEHVFAVFSFAAAAAGSMDVFDGTTGNTRRSYRDAPDRMHLTGNAGAADFAGNVTGAGSTAAHLYEWVFNGAASTLICDATTITSGNVATSAAGGLTLFTFGDGTSNPAAMTLAEMLIVKRILTGNELTNARAYMKAAWGTP